MTTRRRFLLGLASTALARPAFGWFIRTGGSAGLSQVTKTIGSGPPTRDFATVDLWATYLASLGTIPYPVQQVGLAYNDSLFTSTGITIAGVDTSSWTGSGLPAIVLTTGPGQSFRDNANVRTNALTYAPANGVAISINATANGRAITISVPNVALSNLQIQCNNGNRVINSDFAGGAPPIYFDNMIINGNTQSNWVCAQNSVATNCLFEQTANIPTIDGSGTIFDGSVSLSGAKFRFCTVVQYSDTARSDYQIWNTVGEGGLNTVMINSAWFGCSQIVETALSTGGGIAATNSFTDSPPLTPVAAPGLTCNVPFTTTTFFGTSSTTRDWRLPDGSALRATGTPISGVTTDISGFPRNPTTPCVGCWEHA